MYIATDTGGKDCWTAIYGIGETPEAAIEDARRGAGDDAEFDTLEATAGLIAWVRERGGSPNDVDWSVRGGTAGLDSEVESYDTLGYWPDTPCTPGCPECRT
jgi:hypothetical protein